jgi:hypothetical protein
VLESDDIRDRLRTLAAVTVPLWLSGGVAVDFLVGRWTRPHGDVDVIAFHGDRGALENQLPDLGITLAHDGYWTTKWSFRGHRPADIEVVFVDADQRRGSGVLVIPEHDPTGGTAGRYPFVEGYLRRDRWATLDGLRFRVASAEGEWWNRATASGGGVVAGRPRAPKLDHDLALLETLVPEGVRAALLASRR